MASKDEPKGADKGRAGTEKPRPEAAADFSNGNSVDPASAGPQSAPAEAGPVGPRRRPSKLGVRKPQFMISTQAPLGVQPLDANVVMQQLTNSPGIEFVNRIDPPRVLDLQSVGGSAGTVILARMDFEKAALLQQHAGAKATVERDAPLVYSLAPGPADMSFKNPGVLVPHAAGFSTTIEVLGNGQPLDGAEVYIFGSVWPTQGVTDPSGRCQISIIGESPDTIRAIYVKPKLDFWSSWLARPMLVPNGVTTVDVMPLSEFLAEFPEKQLIGWGGMAMGLDKVPPTMTGAGIRIAIIDSGAAQTTHRNLRQVGPGLSVVGPNDDAWTDDAIGHGSHCAGIIAGGPVGPGGAGVRGFAPGAEIHILRIFPGGRFSDLVSALDYCLEHEIDVVNMSLGGGEPSQIIEERLIRAKQMGIACVVAAGNSGGPVQFPASTPHCLAVSAVGQWGTFPADSYHSQQALDGATSGTGYFPASFSCFGPEIDVCAPGVAIVSALPPDGFAAWDGTSMAAPHVTGLAALVLAHHPDFRDAYRHKDARRVERLFQILKESAVPLPVGDAERQGAGLPYAPAALALGTGAQSGVATSASLGGVPIDAAMLEALRQLLGMMNAQPGNGQAATPRPAATEFRPQSAEPWANAAVFRGPARTGGGAGTQAVPDWLSALAMPQLIDHKGLTAADTEAYRRFIASGGTPF